MNESGRDITELKKEVVETRNQTIKTDNQLKNLALNIKSFEKRFDLLEHRTRLMSVGTNAIVAVVIFVTAFLVHLARTAHLEGEVEKSQDEVTAVRAEAGAHQEELNQRIAQLDKRLKHRTATEKQLQVFLGHLDAGRDKAATEALLALDLETASPLVRQLVKDRVDDFRRRIAEAAYRSGKSHLATKRLDPAISDLTKSLEVMPNGRFSASARYLLATNLCNQGRYEQAIPILRQMTGKGQDRSVVDEMRFLLGTSLLKSDGHQTEGGEILASIAGSASRYANRAKDLLAEAEQSPTEKAEKDSAQPSSVASRNGPDAGAR